MHRAVRVTSWGMDTIETLFYWRKIGAQAGSCAEKECASRRFVVKSVIFGQISCMYGMHVSACTEHGEGGGGQISGVQSGWGAQVTQMSTRTTEP